MSRFFLFGGAAALAVAAITWQTWRPSSSETVFVGKNNPPEAAPMCPWREPEADLKLFFADASRYELKTHALSGLRIELGRRIGRELNPDENLLHVYRIYCEKGDALGAVLTRRVKGTHGAIELVLATDTRGQVCGLRLQRLREPENVARELENPQWLRSLYGKCADSNWEIGGEVPDEARSSAAAIARGARDSLILLAGASHAAVPAPARPGHH